MLTKLLVGVDQFEWGGVVQLVCTVQGIIVEQYGVPCSALL